MINRFHAGVGLASALILSAVSCDPSPQPTRQQLDRRDSIRGVEARNSTNPEALQRKQRSMAVLRAEGVYVMETLPVIEVEAGSTRRSTEEVARRAVALAIVAARAEGVDPLQVARVRREFGADAYFSPEERQFMASDSPSEQDRTKFVWRYESACVMLWTLGFVERLERPDHPCGTAEDIRAPLSQGPAAFFRAARLRPQREILDAADLAYRYHWATREAELNGRRSPHGTDGDVVMERHYALLWLIGYMGQSWDDITPDT
jgi:hypothetical protein